MFPSCHLLAVLGASHPVMSTSLKSQKKKKKGVLWGILGVYFGVVLEYIFLIYFLLGALVIFTCKEGKSIHYLCQAGNMKMA